MSGMVRVMVDSLETDRQAVIDAMETDATMVRALAGFVRRGTVQEVVKVLEVGRVPTDELGAKLGGEGGEFQSAGPEAQT